MKSTALAGGGLMLSFSWLTSCQEGQETTTLTVPNEWFPINGFLKIADTGLVTIMSPNPEGGQNIKTSMPMIVADELDVNWEDVRVEQAHLNTDLYQRQFIGGSNAIRFGWKSLRKAGATARYMLKEAAANQWNVPVSEVTTDKGILHHKKSGKSTCYGEMASAAVDVAIPEEIALKEVKDFKIIGTSRKNVDGLNIVTGKPLFGIDTVTDGMLIAMIVHPPAFGLQYQSMKATAIKAMPGIKDVFTIKVLNDDFERQHFDTCAFLEVVAIVGDTTWQVMQAKKAIEIEWTPFKSYKEEKRFYGRKSAETLTIPAGLENTDDHKKAMVKAAATKSKVVRKDGDPDAAFANANRVIERTYTAPYLAHNCMEPMNFYADVRNGSARLIGPLQKAELTEQTLSARLNMPIKNIDIQMSRLGGGYGRRSYANWAIESALISKEVNAPVKLIYSREDDMTGGIYRPAYQATYRAAIDDQNKVTALHINAGGNLESPLYANRFPAGAIDNYLAESWVVNSNITIGSFRAPRSNFIACAEQSFLDELAEEIGQDPFDFRLNLLQKAIKNPVGENNDYDASRYAGVLQTLRDKINWDQILSNAHYGISAYFCHNSYSAQVVALKMEDDEPVIEKVYCSVDCGQIINPDAATNLAEGAIVDGIGNALYGDMTFKNGQPQMNNFHQYRMIRMSEAPKSIEVHFVENNIDPTGMGEPTFPPVFGALANALYQATGKRIYDQPFIKTLQ